MHADASSESTGQHDETPPPEQSWLAGGMPWPPEAANAAAIPVAKNRIRTGAENLMVKSQLIYV